MKFDKSQFDNLELENIGQWPAAAKLVLAIFLAIVVIGLGYMGLISDQIKQLDRVYAEEKTLKQSYRTKYHIAANLDLFRAQMIAAEDSFANQLRSLPNSHETPGLLDDITFIGTTSGLDFVKLKWQPEISKEIYIELPIDIEVIGPYHSFGQFVSKIAGLPRIVTLHDFNIEIEPNDTDTLNLKLQAKTYRYKEKQQGAAK
jgi:type IV pilus assembly protein PilO